MQFDTLNALDADALRAALSGPPEAIARTLETLAEGGAVEAQLRLGQILLDGRGVDRDPRAALHWFGQAAQAGHPMGMNMIGRCCEHGWGTPVDKARAVDWYRAAADRGLDWGLYNLATLLTLGEGCVQDRPRALALFREAAARGHAKSITMVGSFHEDGWVVPVDLAAAADHYARAAEGGDFRGQFNHARMLIAAGDIDAALPWIARAKDGGTPRFLGQLRDWLREQADERLVQLALDL